MNTCGHNAARVTLPSRCCECGAYAHGSDERVFKVPPPLPWPLEWLMRRYIRKHAQAPRLEGRIRRAGGGVNYGGGD